MYLCVRRRWWPTVHPEAVRCELSASRCAAYLATSTPGCIRMHTTWARSILGLLWTDIPFWRGLCCSFISRPGNTFAKTLLVSLTRKQQVLFVISTAATYHSVCFWANTTIESKACGFLRRKCSSSWRLSVKSNRYSSPSWIPMVDWNLLKHPATF